mgnify:CR=1 FL=1
MKVGYIRKFSNLTKKEILNIIDKNLEDNGFLHIVILNYTLFMKGIFSAKIRAAIKRADVIVPEGKLMNWAVWFITKRLIEKDPAKGLFMHLIRKYEKTSKTFFFIGGNRSILNECVINNRKSFPEIKITGSFPEEMLKVREKDVREVIRKTEPNFLFVGLDKGRDERWIQRNKEVCKSSICLGIKDGVEVSAGAKKQPPYWMKEKGWEPLYELLRKPWRIFGIFKLTLFFFIILTNKIFK